MHRWIVATLYVTLKFDGKPWKSIGHLFYTTTSFVHHFKAISEFKLELQSGNAEFRSKSAIVWQGDLKIWWMTLKNNRAPLLYYFKHCASFQSHHWIQTGVTVWKLSIWVKICGFLSRVTLKFDRWPWKTRSTPTVQTSTAPGLRSVKQPIQVWNSLSICYLCRYPENSINIHPSVTA